MSGENDKSRQESGLDTNGDRVVGGSVRADGSVRKTLKVRPGFTPKEEVKRYDVKERRRQREEEELKSTGNTDGRIRVPGSRPNRQFNAINNILGSNSSKPNQNKPSIQETESVKDLESSFDKLGLNNKENDVNASSNDCKDQEVPNKLDTKAKGEDSSSKPKKYVPPSRRNKSS